MKTLLKLRTVAVVLVIVLAQASISRATGIKVLRSDCILETAQNDSGPWSGTPAGPAEAAPAAEASSAILHEYHHPATLHEHHHMHYHHKWAAEAAPSDAGAAPAPDSGAAPAPAPATP
jgi:hypothetical protein